MIVMPPLPTLGTKSGECITGRGEMYRPGEGQSRAKPRAHLGDAIRRSWTCEEPWQGARRGQRRSGVRVASVVAHGRDTQPGVALWPSGRQARFSLCNCWIANRLRSNDLAAKWGKVAGT